MKRYNPIESGWGTHTVRATIQDDNFRGAITVTVGGNCKGIDVIRDIVDDLDFLEDQDEEAITDQISSDCGFKLERYGHDLWFSCILKNDDGDTREIEDGLCNLGTYIVAVEIIDFEPDGDDHDA